MASLPPAPPALEDLADMHGVQRPPVLRQVAVVFGVVAVALLAWKTTADAATVAQFVAKPAAMHGAPVAASDTDDTD